VYTYIALENINYLFFSHLRKETFLVDSFTPMLFYKIIALNLVFNFHYNKYFLTIETFSITLTLIRVYAGTIRMNNYDRPIHSTALTENYPPKIPLIPAKKSAIKKLRNIKK
jgi:hypothetical protein